MAVNGANRDNRRNTLGPMMRLSVRLGKRSPIKSWLSPLVYIPMGSWQVYFWHLEKPD
jgi:hypothetical protein